MADYRLEELSTEHETAFLKGGFGSHTDSLIVPHEITTPAQFRKFVKESDKQRLDWRPGPNKTSVTRYALFDPQGQLCALGLLRFPLDEASEASGGNLVCEVPPSLRRNGHGSMCLALLLFEAVRAGLRRVYLSCAKDNHAARRMIEINRGQLERIDTENDLARYWIQFN